MAGELLELDRASEDNISWLAEGHHGSYFFVVVGLTELLGASRLASSATRADLLRARQLRT